MHVALVLSGLLGCHFVSNGWHADVALVLSGLLGCHFVSSGWHADVALVLSGLLGCHFVSSCWHADVALVLLGLLGCHFVSSGWHADVALVLSGLLGCHFVSSCWHADVALVLSGLLGCHFVSSCWHADVSLVLSGLLGCHFVSSGWHAQLGWVHTSISACSFTHMHGMHVIKIVKLCLCNYIFTCTSAHLFPPSNWALLQIYCSGIQRKNTTKLTVHLWFLSSLCNFLLFGWALEYHTELKQRTDKIATSSSSLYTGNVWFQIYGRQFSLLLKDTTQILSSKSTKYGDFLEWTYNTLLCAMEKKLWGFHTYQMCMLKE